MFLFSCTLLVTEETFGWLTQDDTLLEPVELGRKHHRVFHCLDSGLTEMGEHYFIFINHFIEAGNDLFLEHRTKILVNHAAYHKKYVRIDQHFSDFRAAVHGGQELIDSWSSPLLKLAFL